MELQSRNGASFSKWSFDFKMELPFWNGVSKLHFEIEAPFQNRSSILKSKLNLEIEAPLWNRSSIFKWKLHLKIEVWFWNLSSISKCKLQKSSVYLSCVSVVAQMEHRTIAIVSIFEILVTDNEFLKYSMIRLMIVSFLQN